MQNSRFSINITLNRLVEQIKKNEETDANENEGNLDHN